MAGETRLYETGGSAVRQRRLFLVVLLAMLLVNVNQSGRRSAASRSIPVWPVTVRSASTQLASTQPASTQPARRVLLRQDFERERGDWSGRILTENVPVGSTRALGATPTETHWARRASVGGRGTIRAAADTVLTFRYYMSKDIPLTIYIMNRTQKDNLRYDIQKPVVGRWTEVRLNVSTDFRRNDGSAGKLQAGDVLTGISFLAGKTGTDEFDMAVDDVEVAADGANNSPDDAQ
jgi:hypothetical protein